MAVAGGALWLFVRGFVLFAARVSEMPDAGDVQADGIVVLTGGPARLAEAARLLQDKRGERLLISGINTHTNRDSLLPDDFPKQYDPIVLLEWARQRWG